MSPKMIWKPIWNQSGKRFGNDLGHDSVRPSRWKILEDHFGGPEIKRGVSVTGRTERDLVKRFDDLGIDWAVLEKQLETWSHLFGVGKRLWIEMTLNYIEARGPIAAARQGSKLRCASAS